MRKFPWIAGAAAVALATAIVLIPAGGSADVADDTNFTPVVKQGGSTVTTLTVYGCTPGTGTGAVPNAQVRATSGTGSGTTGNAVRIRVYSPTGDIAYIYALDTDTQTARLTFRCSGTETWTFQPERCQGTYTAATGTCLRTTGLVTADGWENATSNAKSASVKITYSGVLASSPTR